jgi:hypothetical protein
MKYTVYVKHKYPRGLYRSSHYAYTKIGAWIKALWDTKGSWQYFDYQFE